MNLALKSELKHKVAQDTLGVIQFLCGKLPEGSSLSNEFYLLESEWVRSDNEKLSGMLTGEQDFVLKNMITKSLLHWIDKLRETDLDALHSKNQVSAENETDSQALESKSEISTKPEYRILCLSYNEKDRKKMAGLFAQFPELKVDAQISSALPARLSGYHLLLFDNYSLGKIDHIDDAPDDEARGHLQLMVKWLYDKKKNEDREIRPGFLIHYGKSSEIVNEYSDYCAAANFPFTLYGLIRQIIDFWQDSQTSFLNQEALIEGE